MIWSLVFAGLVLLAVVAVLPYVVYVSVKLGTFAFLRGRELFNQSRREVLKDGDEKEGGTQADRFRP